MLPWGVAEPTPLCTGHVRRGACLPGWEFQRGRQRGADVRAIAACLADAAACGGVDEPKMRYPCGVQRLRDPAPEGDDGEARTLQSSQTPQGRLLDGQWAVCLEQVHIELRFWRDPTGTECRMQGFRGEAPVLPCHPHLPCPRRGTFAHEDELWKAPAGACIEWHRHLLLLRVDALSGSRA
jgi:hypothetical protein